MSLENLEKVDPEVFSSIKKEFNRQQTKLEMIASENFTSLAVMEAQGTVLTNKYAEGLPDKRYYGGCEYYDQIEKLAIERAKKLFSAEHVNVQPHSGAQANFAVFLAALNPGDTILGMSLDQGGHLTHGSKANVSGKWFKSVFYGVNESGFIDYDELAKIAKNEKPKLIIAGASAYSRTIHFDKFKSTADSIGALLMVDMAHIAGLVATGLHPSPFPHADFVTTTTHKTLRGPRGGMVFCKQKYAKQIDSAVFPGSQGGPLMHVIAAKAIALKEALMPEFKSYQIAVVENAKILAKTLIKNGIDIVSGGTDNHLLLADLRKVNLTGKEAEILLDSVGITCNKNTIPRDPQSPFVTSGIRLGTPAITTRGMRTKEMELLGEIISKILKDPSSEAVKESTKHAIESLCKAFPLYIQYASK
ncbi:MAG: serine hydroxymethyltransferase [Candidatus Melainabacteria bacterium]|nr:serine hydroxymethyltransferase [Candidatus Melainabacteria bacterium]